MLPVYFIRYGEGGRDNPVQPVLGYASAVPQNKDNVSFGAVEFRVVETDKCPRFVMVEHDGEMAAIPVSELEPKGKATFAVIFSPR